MIDIRQTQTELAQWFEVDGVPDPDIVTFRSKKEVQIWRVTNPIFVFCFVLFCFVLFCFFLFCFFKVLQGKTYLLIYTQW